MFPTVAMSKMVTLILCDLEVTLTLKLAFHLHPTSPKNGNAQIVFEYIMCIMTSILKKIGEYQKDNEDNYLTQGFSSSTATVLRLE